MARKFRLGRSRKNAERKSQQHKKSTCFVKKGRPTKKIGIQQLSTGIYLPPLWSNQSSMQFVHFCKIEHGSSNQTAATVTKSVTINEDLSWSVNVHGHKLIADPSHLIKTVRNCWANSYGHSYTRKLKINGQDISWQHLVDLYKAHRGPDCATLGLSILPKLKWEHIELNSYSKMRVDLAAQVLSTTVAEAFAYENSPHTKETERFVRIFDKFFDLMNTRNTKEFVLKRKPNLAPYINNPETEERLKWLQDVFLPYLDEWEAYAHAQEHLSSAEQIKLCLSQETLQGLRITVHAFIELVRYLLKQPRVVYVLSAKLSQDCVESFFGKQRMRGGYCENPNVSSFISGGPVITCSEFYSNTTT
eukprot:Em0001g890a